MKIPTHLSHKPILSVEYEKYDSFYKNDSDAKFLSIGKAGYDNSKLSVKVWRNTGVKWSRQSEELPLHRNLDLTILALSSMNYREGASLSRSALEIDLVDKSKLLFLNDQLNVQQEEIEDRIRHIKKLCDDYLSK